MNEELISALNRIPVADISYDDWLRIGMALKYEGCSADVWEDWSKADPRYKAGECEKKWRGFTSPMGAPATKATIFQIANSYGWKSEKRWDWKDKNIPFGWDDAIGGGAAENEPAQSFAEYALPDEWNPSEQLITYLETLFKPDDIIGYVTDDVFNEDGQWKPRKGAYSRRAGDVIESIKKHPDDLGATLGDCKPGCGAWIRFNPLDGEGVRNENVVEFRYALVESDTMSLSDQDALYRRLELPIATLTYSGGKSLHAVVHIDADNYDEYRKRVEYLYDYLQKNGAVVDKQNRNPSRLSRMPGIMRGEKRQQLIETNIGKASWLDWFDFAENNMEDLPDVISIADSVKNPPVLPPVLIDGILRCGHKMLISGASKAGKSFLLMELAISLAEGTEWLGFSCRKTRVLYINLEIDPASCQQRFLDIYKALDIKPKHADDIRLWNLRGFATPLDVMVPKIVRKAIRERANVIIVDPIYKVITGDENNASEMGNFCNQFDRIANETGCSVIYCHHHSKGAQGSKKAQDRASGSGVFARDPDAQLDLIQLDLTDDQKNNLADDGATAWRLESSLREFRNIKPLNFWFEYPIHRVDTSGELDKSYAEGSAGANLGKSSKRNTKVDEFENAFNYCDTEGNGHVKLADLASYLDVHIKTARRYLDDYPDDYTLENGIIFRNSKSTDEQGQREIIPMSQVGQN